MSQNQQTKGDLLEEAIQAFQRMSVPKRPPDAEVLGQLDTRQADLFASACISHPSKRMFRIRPVISCTAAAVVVLGVLAFVLSDRRSTNPLGVPAVTPADTPRFSATWSPAEKETTATAAVDSFENRLKESQVIVVAAAESSSPAPPEASSDEPEFLIQFKVRRILKGELPDKVITVRTFVASDKIVGQDWIVWLSPGYVAGNHQRAPLTTAEFEPRLKEILAREKKSTMPLD
jgi:hypothetical protein